MITLDELKAIWFEVLRPATYAEIVCIGGFVISLLVVFALMTGA